MPDKKTSFLDPATSNDGSAEVAVLEGGANRKGILNALLGATTFGRSILTVADRPGFFGILGTGTKDATTVLYGDGAWRPPPSGGGGGGTVADYGDVVILNGTTNTPDAALLTSPGALFRWQLSGNSTLNAPTGVPSGKAQGVTVLVQQPTSGGPYTLTLGSGITPGTVTLDPTANAVTRLDLETFDGGTTWLLTGGGTDLTPGTYLGADQSGLPRAMSGLRTIGGAVSRAPVNGEVFEFLAPHAGIIKALRGKATGTGTPTFTASIAINGVAVTGLSAQTFGAAASRVLATAANVFAAGDAITITMGAPGGTVTRFNASVEYEQTA